MADDCRLIKAFIEFSSISFLFVFVFVSVLNSCKQYLVTDWIALWLAITCHRSTS